MNKRLLVIASVLTLSGVALGLGTEAIANAQTTTAVHAHTAAHKSHPHKNRHLGIRLNQAVRDGTITRSQKTAFTAELHTLRAERKSVIHTSSAKAERQAEHTKLKAELQTWVSTNNFPLSKIAPHLAS